MSEEQKEKPIRELLQDISSNIEQSRVEPRGLVSPQLVNRITFFASLACLVLITGTFVALIWGGVVEEFAFQCIGTMVVLLTALFVFRAINTHFD